MYNIYLGIIALVASLPVAAPILLKLSESYQVFLWPARALYFLYSFTCHQFHHRSLYLFDYQLAWCARDTGIWLGILGAAILVKKYKIGLPWYWIIPFVVPIAMDGGIQTVATLLGMENPYGVTGDILYVSNNLVRFMTGGFFGIGMGLVFSPMILDLQAKLNFTPDWHKLWPRLTGLVVSLFVVYFALVQVWNFTSVNNKPSDVLDTAVKTPSENLFVRRSDGACPASSGQMLAFNCD